MKNLNLQIKQILFFLPSKSILSKSSTLFSLNLMFGLFLPGNSVFANQSSGATAFPDIYHVPGSMTDEPNDESIRSSVRYDIGPLVKPEDAPGLHRILGQIFSDLSFAQGRLTEGAAATVNYVHIAESSVLNAFVWIDNDTGVRLFANHLYITSGLIRLMMTGVPVEVGLLRLAGVIAHELGHPMDRTSAWEGEGGTAISNHYGTEADQGIEIRADIDGMRILREANYPIDALYKFLTHLFGKERGASHSLLGSLSSTHPHHEFRLTSARLYLTLDRLEKGILTRPKQFSFSDEELRGFNDDVDKVIPKNGRYPYKIPVSMAEVTNRVKALKEDDSIGKDFKTLELNRLVLSFDHMLLKKQQTGVELTREERQEFSKFLEATYAMISLDPKIDSGIALYSPTEIRSNINTISGVSGLENSLSHYTFIERLEAYRAPEVIAFLKTLRATKLTDESLQKDYAWEVSHYLLGAASLAAPDAFFEVFKKPMRNLLRQMSLTGKGSKGTADGHLTSLEKLGMGFQVQAALLGAPVRHLMERMPFQIRLLWEPQARHSNPLPIVEQHNPKEESPILRPFRQSLVYLRSGKHPELEKEVNALREIFLEIWEARGFYGTLEILLQRNMIDWPLIIEILGLDPKMALNQVESEVIKYLKGERKYRNILPYRALIMAAAPLSNMDTKGLDRWLIWNSRNLKQYLLMEYRERESGEVPAAKLDDLEKQRLNYYYGAFRIKNKTVFDQDYRATMQKTVAAAVTPIKGTIVSMARAHSKFFNGAPYGTEIREWDNAYFMRVQLDLVDQSERPNEEKKFWFESLFLTDLGFKNAKDQKDWDDFLYSIGRPVKDINYMSKPSVSPKVLEVFRSLYQKDSVEFFTRLKEFARVSKIEDNDFFAAIDTSEPTLQKDIKERTIKSFADIQFLMAILKPIEHRRTIYEKSLGENAYTEPRFLADSTTIQLNSSRIQRLKATILQKASSLELSDKQKLQMFLDLTESGPTKDTDKLFLSLYDLKALSEDIKPTILQYLDDGRFSSDALRLDLAKLFIGGRVDRLKSEVIEKGGTVDRYTLNRLIKDLNRYAPNGSIAKDDFMETIGWSLRLRGSELDGFIDDQKSSNWRRANPMLVRVGSLLATQISNMSFGGRLKTIEYLLDPVNNETTLFNDIFEELKKITYNDLLKEATGLLTPQKLNDLKTQANRMAEVLKLKAEEAIRDSAPSERIPLFEVIMTAGLEAPIRKADWPVNIARRYLKYVPNSVEEVLFTTFLEVVPEHEGAVALAYMLSLANDESNGSIAQLFEVFGTVGIKFGQLVSIWELFGEKLAKEAAHLKNRAKGLGRADVIDLAHERHHEVKAIVEEFEKILGSASIKTTVRVRFKDGTKGVLALQGRNVSEIVKMNIELGKRYLERLKEKGVIKNSKFMMNLVEALEEQIIAELDMRTEAQKTQIAGEILAKMNNDLGGELNGWTLKAPQVLANKPLTEQMAFYELAKSKTFDELSAEEKAEVGPMIAKAMLRFLFHYGYFDPDRHTGNILIDLATKTIYFLDFGQFENFAKSINPFKMDPRLVIGKFIHALSELDTEGVIHYARLMARPGTENGVSEKELRAKLQILFDKQRLAIKNAQVSDSQSPIDVKDLMVDVINEVAENGVTFSTRYIFGGLKGLIILYGEKYVTVEEFEMLLRAELKSLFLAKLPAIMAEKVKPISTDQTPPPPSSSALRCEQALKKDSAEKMLGTESGAVKPTSISIPKGSITDVSKSK
jgi:hypothetical protein